MAQKPRVQSEDSVAEQPAEEKAARGPRKCARMLRDYLVNGIQVRCNQLVDGEESVIAALVKGGIADDAETAVEYARNESDGEPVEV